MINTVAEQAVCEPPLSLCACFLCSLSGRNTPVATQVSVAQTHFVAARAPHSELASILFNRVA